MRVWRRAARLRTADEGRVRSGGSIAARCARADLDKMQTATFRAATVRERRLPWTYAPPINGPPNDKVTAGATPDVQWDASGSIELLPSTSALSEVF